MQGDRGEFDSHLLHMKKILALVMFLLLGATACNPVIVGDSIADMTRAEFSQAMPLSLTDASPGRGAYNGGWGGQPRTGLEAIKHNIQFVDDGGWMIVELGSNNMDWAYGAKTTFVAQVVAAVPDDICLGWVVPYSDYYGTDFRWAEAIYQEIQAQPCWDVIRWDLAVQFDPSLTYDWVHPSQKGKEVLAFLIEQTVEGCGC